MDKRLQAETATCAVDVAMERYADGDDAAFGEVYDALAPRLFKFIARRAHDPALAADLLQETFLNICSARASFFRGAKVMPWAFTIARRLVIDRARSSKRQVQIASPEEMEAAPPASTDDPADQLIAARQVAERVERELSRMPETQREAYMLIRVDGLSIADAAEVLGITPNAVKLRAFRAYDALRASLGGVLEEERSP